MILGTKISIIITVPYYFSAHHHTRNQHDRSNLNKLKIDVKQQQRKSHQPARAIEVVENIDKKEYVDDDIGSSHSKNVYFDFEMQNDGVHNDVDTQQRSNSNTRLNELNQRRMHGETLISGANSYTDTPIKTIDSSSAPLLSKATILNEKLNKSIDEQHNVKHNTNENSVDTNYLQNNNNNNNSINKNKTHLQFVNEKRKSIIEQQIEAVASAVARREKGILKSLLPSTTSLFSQMPADKSSKQNDTVIASTSNHAQKHNRIINNPIETNNNFLAINTFNDELNDEQQQTNDELTDDTFSFDSNYEQNISFDGKSDNTNDVMQPAIFRMEDIDLDDLDETSRNNRLNLMKGRDVVTNFLQIVESQHLLGANCTAGTALNLGEGVVDRYAQDRFRVEAEVAVNRANMLTR